MVTKRHDPRSKPFPPLNPKPRAVLSPMTLEANDVFARPVLVASACLVSARLLQWLSVLL